MDTRPAPATMKADELAGLLGCSTFTIYQMVKKRTCPVPPIRLGRKLVFARGPVNRLLQPVQPGVQEAP